MTTVMAPPKPDAEPLEEGGYFCTVNQVRDSFYFNAVDRFGERIGQVLVMVPPMNTYSTWRHRDDTYMSISSARDVDGREARALAEVISLASIFTDTLNEQWEAERAERERRAEEMRAKQEAEREAFRARREAERAERAKKIEARMEELQYYVGEKFRLKRRGYRATVFGTIDDFRFGRMYTTSEKGKPMHIDVLSIYWMEIKQGRDYETIIDEPEYPAREEN